MLTPIELYRELGRRVSPFLKHYRTDLKTHDKAWILANPGVAFCHWTSESSTHLVPMFPHDSPTYPGRGEEVAYLFSTATREHILQQTCEIARCLGEQRQFNNRITLHYDGRQLVEVSAKAAIRIVQDHVGSVREAWNPTPRRPEVFYWQRQLQAA